MSRYLLEGCVDSVESALAAAAGGADRIELCANLVIGGTTPDIYMYRQIRELTDIKINVLIRPRFGDFCYSDFEYEQMVNQAEEFARYGADGIVIGILLPDGNLDYERVSGLMKAAPKLSVTLHRAYDQACNPLKQLEAAIEMGVDTILTSGQQQSAIQGAELLAKLNEAAGNRIEIMAGGGISAEVIPELHAKTGIRNYHMSGKTVLDSPMNWRNPNVNMGLPSLSEYEIWRTDEQSINRARLVLDDLRADK